MVDDFDGILVSDFDQENYKMDHKNRGIAIIINVVSFKNDEEKYREGSCKDTERLKEILKAMKFEIKEPRDSKKKSISTCIKEGEANLL